MTAFLGLGAAAWVLTLIGAGCLAKVYADERLRRRRARKSQS